MDPSDPHAPPAAAASSPASATGDAAGLLGDGGPVFDPDAADDAPELPGADDALAGGDLWKEPRVRGLLTAKGELLHGALAVGKGESNEWRYTDADLRAIAPPLTRILNRYEPTRAAAAAGDELTVAVGFAGYAVRSWSERMAWLRLLRAEQPEPEPGQIAVPVIDVRDQAADDGAADAGPPPVPPIRPRR